MKFTTALWLVPLVVIAALVAVANRAAVVFHFNPLSPDDAAYAATMPVFVLVFLVFFAGALFGGSFVAVRRALKDRRARLAAKAAAKAAQTLALDAKPEGGPQTPL